ncbi:hypothetical protein [Sphingobacterium suaedae]|uniref:Phytase-like domain-containing protein n=1 Tax=Sphingobacterium suaedae TaxID=1686402 RepID=A0ABW5KCY8_9SPHI
MVFAQNTGRDREPLGKITDSRLGELSGLIVSRQSSSLFWTHNDSGDSARIFLIDDKAQTKITYLLEGVRGIDTEDIACFQRGGKNFVVLADIGDNRAVRKEVKLYIFEEPLWDGKMHHDIISAEAITQVTLRYEDGARDAEALFIDPLDLTGYIISKRDFQVGVYPFSLDNALVGQSLVLKRKFDLPMTFVTAADMTRDGAGLLIKNLTQVFYWERKRNETILQMLGRKPRTLTYQPEPQGEAICFGDLRGVFYTISERPLGLDAYLYRYYITPLH